MVKPALAKYVGDHEDDWDLFLQMTISGHNNAFHASIGMAPYEFVFGSSFGRFRGQQVANGHEVMQFWNKRSAGVI